MPTFERFEDIDAWQKARQLVRSVYEASGRGPFARELALQGQIRRAAVSVMGNIAEGFDRGSTREFVQFLGIAKGSGSEVRSHLYAALDQCYLTDQKFGELSSSAEEVGRMVGGLLAYLRKSGMRGPRLRQA